MKTAQSMLALRARSGIRTAWRLALLILIAIPLAGCANQSKRGRAPTVLVSPYPDGTEAVIAVAPLRNESGVSLVDELNLTDTLVNEAQQVRGLSVLPVNRTLAAMRALKMPAVTSAGEAHALMKALQADGLIVGTITAYDPYDPPTLGMTLALFGGNPSLRAQATPREALDPRALQGAPRESGEGASHARPSQALSSVSHVLDASSGETRELVRAYATGRHDPDGPMGWQRYVRSMALYAKFACFEMTRRLLELEAGRIASLEARSQTVSAR